MILSIQQKFVAKVVFATCCLAVLSVQVSAQDLALKSAGISNDNGETSIYASNDIPETPFPPTYSLATSPTFASQPIKSDEKTDSFSYAAFATAGFASILSGLTAFMFVWHFRSKAKTHQESNRQPQNEHPINEVETSLEAHVLTMLHKGSTVSELKDAVSEIQKEKEEHDPAANRLIGEMMRRIHKATSSANDWMQFENLFTKRFPDFVDALVAKYPKLTAHEKRLSSLIKLELSSKEIAGLLGISHHSVNVARYRMRKKMELTKEDDLAVIIGSI